MTTVQPLPDERCVIARLDPGQSFTVAFPGRKPVQMTAVEGWPETWTAVWAWDDDVPVAKCSYRTARKVELAERPRTRAPITDALNNLVDGAVAVVQFEWGNRYGRMEWLPVDHRIVFGAVAIRHPKHLPTTD